MFIGPFQGQAHPSLLESFARGESIQLDPELWVGPLRDDLADELFHACLQRGKDWDHSWAFNSPWAMVRVLPAEVSVHSDEFDSDRKLWTTAMLSRLIRPNSLAHEFTGRVHTLTSGDRRIVPFQPYGVSRQAFVAVPNQDGLTRSDLADLSYLVACWKQSSLSDRCTLALWHFEFASRSYFTEARWMHIAAGLEALSKVRDEKGLNGRPLSSTKSFVGRHSLIVERLGRSAPTQKQLRDFYSGRSDIIHGHPLHEMPPEIKDTYLAGETHLRELIRMAIEAPLFAACFKDSESISESFPASAFPTE